MPPPEPTPAGCPFLVVLPPDDDSPDVWLSKAVDALCGLLNRYFEAGAPDGCDRLDVLTSAGYVLALLAVADDVETAGLILVASLVADGDIARARHEWPPVRSRLAADSLRLLVHADGPGEPATPADPPRVAYLRPPPEGDRLDLGEVLAGAVRKAQAAKPKRPRRHKPRPTDADLLRMREEKTPWKTVAKKIGSTVRQAQNRHAYLISLQSGAE